jgi:hypothetical protein
MGTLKEPHGCGSLLEKVAAGNSKPSLDHSAPSKLPFCHFNDRKEASAAMAAARQHMSRARRCGITQPSSLASDPLVDGQKVRRSTRYFNQALNKVRPVPAKPQRLHACPRSLVDLRGEAQLFRVVLLLTAARFHPIAFQYPTA